MIEKLKNIPIDMDGGPSAVWVKINELVDAINPILEERESGIKVYEETMEMVKQNTLEDRMIGCDTLEIPPTYKTDIQRAADSANKNLDNALTVAVDALKRIGSHYPPMTDLYRMEIANDAIKKIAKILKVKQKD